MEGAYNHVVFAQNVFELFYYEGRERFPAALSRGTNHVRYRRLLRQNNRK